MISMNFIVVLPIVAEPLFACSYYCVEWGQWESTSARMFFGRASASSAGLDELDPLTPSPRPALPALGTELHVLEAGRLSASARVGRASMGGAESDNLPAAPGNYLTAPAVSPPTMYFCRNRNSAITGAAAMIAPAENALQSA